MVSTPSDGSLKTNLSAPKPPVRVSAPAPPIRRSAPLPPLSVSDPLEPVIRSSPMVPLINPLPLRLCPAIPLPSTGYAGLKLLVVKSLMSVF